MVGKGRREQTCCLDSQGVGKRPAEHSVLPNRSTGSSQQRRFITGSEGTTRCRAPGQRPVGRCVRTWLGLGWMHSCALLAIKICLNWLAKSHFPDPRPHSSAPSHLSPSPRTTRPVHIWWLERKVPAQLKASGPLQQLWVQAVLVVKYFDSHSWAWSDPKSSSDSDLAPGGRGRTLRLGPGQRAVWMLQMVSPGAHRLSRGIEIWQDCQREPHSGYHGGQSCPPQSLRVSKPLTADQRLRLHP